MEQKLTLTIFTIVAALALLSVVAIMVDSIYYTNPALLAARPPPTTNGTSFGCQPNSKAFNASGGNCAHIRM
jgi:hypothetical protein